MSEATGGTPSADMSSADVQTADVSETTLDTTSSDMGDESVETTEDSTSEASPEQVVDAAQDVKDAVQQAKDAKTPQEKANAKKAVEQAVKRYKIVVDGQEMEVDETELIKGYQRATAANKRFEQAAKYRKETEQALTRVKSDTARVLKQLGVDPETFATEYLSKVMEEEALPPEEKEKQAMKKELEQLREEKRQIELKKQQEEQLAMENRYAEELDSKVTKALQSANLPKTPKTVAMIAEKLHAALENGYELDPEDVVDMVKDDYMIILNDILGAADGGSLLNLIKEDNLKKIRTADVARVKSKAPATPTKTSQVASPNTDQPSKKEKKMSTSDFLAAIESKIK